MDSLNEDVCKSLIKWLQTFETENVSETVEALSNGVTIAQVLVQIAPDYFIRFNSNIHSDIGTNWRLKVNNLKKILKSLEEYYQDVLNLHLLEIAKPNLVKIGEHCDLVELGKLLRLILGCAVNCEDKQKYITRIMDMEELVQQNIMQAIQQLEAVTHGRGRSSLSLLGVESDAKYQRLLNDLEAASESKDILSQKCYNLEKQIVCLTEEKFALASENTRIMNKIKEFEHLQNCIEDNEGGAIRNTEMRRQLDSLKEDLIKMETQRDDYRIKAMEQEKDIQMLQEKISDLQSAAEKAVQLKDEVDALNETAEKAKALEVTVSSYKRKLEEYADLKKKYKILKDENEESYQQNLKLEEELKRNAKYKTQFELYKKQVSELHVKVDEEMQKIDKLTFENKKLESKINILIREKDCLIAERDTLKEANEELRYHNQRPNVNDEETAVASELVPTGLQTRVKRLEQENLSLKLAVEESAAKQVLLDDTNQRLEKIIEQNRMLNQRILELEAQLEESSNVDESMYKQKCISLQEQLQSKDNELHIYHERHNKNVEKAKEVNKQLEVVQKTSPIIKSKDNLNGEDKTGKMSEMEEKLITSCFYKLGVTYQREAIDEKFAQLTSQGQSFLSRQRQSMPRRSMQPYRSK